MLGCAICLEPLSNQSVAKANPCCHSYHFECLNMWTKTSSQCPTCRTWMKEMALESGIRYPIDKKEQSKLDFQPPSPNYFANGIIEEQEDTCSRCLNSLSRSSFFICESCDCKIHPMCQDDDYCPNCGWHKLQLVCASAAGKRKLGLNKTSNLDQVENIMYSKIVDELKLKNRKDVRCDKEVEDAWFMLDKALNDDVKDETNGAVENSKDNTIIEADAIEDNMKLKKPNVVTHSLTMNALAKHDSSTNGTHLSTIQCEYDQSVKKLSYIEKLLIYRLLIKPRIPVDLKPQIYTRVSKKISRSLYVIILNNKYAMLSMKSVMEYSEREGILLKDKQSIDLLLGQEKNNSIVKSFMNGDYLKLQLGEKWIQNMINREVSKY